MTIDTNSMVSITEANQNFSKVARMVDELGFPQSSSRTMCQETWL